MGRPAHVGGAADVRPLHQPEGLLPEGVLLCCCGLHCSFLCTFCLAVVQQQQQQDRGIRCGWCAAAFVTHCMFTCVVCRQHHSLLPLATATTDATTTTTAFPLLRVSLCTHVLLCTCTYRLVSSSGRALTLFPTRFAASCASCRTRCHPCHQHAQSRWMVGWGMHSRLLHRLESGVGRRLWACLSST